MLYSVCLTVNILIFYISFSAATIRLKCGTFMRCVTSASYFIFLAWTARSLYRFSFFFTFFWSSPATLDNIRPENISVFLKYVVGRIYCGGLSHVKYICLQNLILTFCNNNPLVALFCYASGASKVFINFDNFSLLYFLLVVGK